MSPIGRLHVTVYAETDDGRRPIEFTHTQAQPDSDFGSAPYVGDMLRSLVLDAREQVERQSRAWARQPQLMEVEL